MLNAQISKSKSIGWAIMLSTFATATVGIAILELNYLWGRVSRHGSGNAR